MEKRTITIKEVKNEIDDHLLDIIGNEFKFDHVKGMAEWLKNSVDAYRRNNVHQESQEILFRFTDQGVTEPIIESIDFVGMSKVDIEKSFKRWGDPNAAKRGNKSGKKMYGGHGNGGKFYMRQMFSESRFVTYKDSVLNIFGFSPNKKYGFAKGYEDKKMSPKQALEFAEIANVVPSEIKKRIVAGETGFTVVQGVGPHGVKTKFKLAKDIERLKNHPQSRRILSRTKVDILYNDHVFVSHLRPDELPPLANFSEPRVTEVPSSLTTHSGSEKVVVQMANAKYPPGRLILRTSAEALVRGSSIGELNRIDILGEIGSIGSYSMHELGVTGFPSAAFIYGEFGPAEEGGTSILEDPDNDCVSNDRAKLVDNDTSRALVEWLAKEVDKLAAEITAVEREKQKENQKDITSKFNDVLNEWKNKHMDKILSDLFGSGDGKGHGGGNDKPQSEVTLPPNGFDFKYPRAEIEINATARLTLKIRVPETLPVGATIFVSSDSDKIKLLSEKYYVKSENLRYTEAGEGVAFITIEVVGLAIGSEATIAADDKKHKATMTVAVVEKKEEKSGKSFPRVLLSSHDEDPLGTGRLVLGERDPIVYQRPQDVSANIYWINTSSPLASKIYDKFKFDSVQWRNYLFDRYVDIFVKEAVHELERKDSQNFSADAVDQKIGDVIQKVHNSANQDLDQFLFDSAYVVPTTPANGK